MLRLVILISGRGSNMEAILDAGLPVRVSAVLSNRSDAAGLDIARQRGIPVEVIDHRSFASREAFDAKLGNAIAAHAPDFIVLAGFMRVLGAAFISRFQGRILNIHPSLLPAFPGLHTHRRALEAGVTVHGATVHVVTPELDHGPILAQVAVPVLPDDTEDTLSARVLKQEHALYPAVLQALADGRLSIGPAGVVRRQQGGVDSGASERFLRQPEDHGG
ncbi:MAG: phosphoribosylglycinamide formyltransferase [Betaproteobacteria bacterium]|nr:phosphoribosylglycinamide formyltransferase [Betaproteobacteria bacterium]